MTTTQGNTKAMHNYLVKFATGIELQVSAHNPDEAHEIAQNLAPTTGPGLVYKYVDGKAVIA